MLRSLNSSRFHFIPVFVRFFLSPELFLFLQMFAIFIFIFIFFLFSFFKWNRIVRVQGDKIEFYGGKCPFITDRIEGNLMKNAAHSY